MPLGDLLLKANLENYDPSVAKDMPTYPGLMLSAHVLRENIQMGSVLGSGLGAGWWLVRPKTTSLLKAAWPRGAVRGAGFGFLTAAGMMGFKMQTIDLEGLEDRAYRLGQNRKVETLDLCSAAGAMAMILPGVFMRHAPGATGLFPLGYAAQGMSVGVLAFVAAQATGIGIVDMLTKDKDEK